MSQLKCFIACAFDQQDVDLIYDKSIVPILRQLKITPRRVDRINHNDKIDGKIIDLMQKCDFAIADLTYARPSVYFEAGFMEGLGKSVIFIARSDHFKAKENDSSGNERIHFDLITKNIIGWTKPNKTFKQKLESRIKLILRPVIFKKRISLEEQESKKIFRGYSLSEKLRMCLLAKDNLIGKLKLKPIKVGHIKNVFHSKKYRFSFEVLDNISYHDLIWYGHQAGELSLEYSIPSFKVFYVISKLPRSKIERALAHFKPLNQYVYQSKNVKYLFYDGIDSELNIKNCISNFESELRQEIINNIK